MPPASWGGLFHVVRAPRSWSLENPRQAELHRSRVQSSGQIAAPRETWDFKHVVICSHVTLKSMPPKLLQAEGNRREHPTSIRISSLCSTPVVCAHSCAHLASLQLACNVPTAHCS